MRTLSVMALVMAACGSGPYYGGSSAPVMTGQDPQQPAGGDPQPPEAQPDTRNAGQVVADIMAQSGYTCKALDASWECTSGNGPWQLYVSYVVSDDQQTTTIWFDSYLERAFAKPCSEWANAMTDVADTNSSFQGTCDDSTKKFRFNTAVTYGSDLDVMSWVRDHEAHRMKAAQNLRGIHALSRDSARLLGN